ncbi:hypothetical protein QWY15_12115 [Planococcus sp. N064]|uniref:TMhelix containing protein n=1 Tax=Planococcus liqunii TaxID=3058394 RepID=A0ABT8MTH3_9BACL|nr:hypothetical protein [Planococcus sp. N064]MDN7228044.1 hypothetical protein [Planococcus sp. N064]
MIQFMDDVVGAIVDNIKLIGYFLAGVLGVSAAFYAIAGAFDILAALFY